MATKTRAKDDSSLNRCRIELPKLVDDLGLSVYAFRLYAHLKRIADEMGSCWEGARTLAAACGMSPGQVSKAKEELAARGLIIRNIKAVRGGIADDITIADIWPQTFDRYAPGSGGPKESDHHTITSQPKRSYSDHLDESDHTAITSGESDHQANTLTSKRSYSDPIDHVFPYKNDHDSPPPPTPPTPPGGGGGDRSGEPTETESYLLDEGFQETSAYEFRDIPLATAQHWVKKLRKEGMQNGGIVRQWRRRRPAPPPAANGHEPPPPIRAPDALDPATTVARLVARQKENT